MNPTPVVQQIILKPSGDARTASVLRQVKGDLKAIGAEASSASRSIAGAVSGGAALSKSREIAGAAGGVASVVGGGTAVSAAGSILALTAAGGALGAVAGVATVAFSALQAELDRTAKAAEEAAAKIKSRADLVAGGATSDDVTRQIQNLQAGQGVVENYLDQLNALRDKAIEIDSSDVSLDKIDAALNGVFTEIEQLTGESVNSIADLRPLIEASTEDFNEYGNKILDLNDLLVSGELAANDAAAAQAALTKSQLDGAQLLLRADQMTAEARADRVAAIENEVAILQDALKNTDLTADASAEFTRQLAALRAEQTAITAVTESYADTVNKANIALDNKVKRDQQILDLTKQQVDAQEKAQQIYTEIATLQADAASEIATLTAEAAEEGTEIEAEAAEERVEIAEDSADAIAKIMRDSGRAMQQSIGDRDAAAVRQAKIAQADQLEDQTKADGKALKQLETAKKKELDAVDKGQRQQLASIMDGANKEIMVKRRQAAEQEFIAATSANSIQFLMRNGMDNVVNDTANAMNTVQSIFITAGQNVVGALNNIFSGLFSGGTPLVTSHPTLSSTYGAAIPSTQAAFNQQFDARMAQTLGLGYGQIGRR